MAIIYTSANVPSVHVHNGFVKQGRTPNLFGTPKVDRAIARSIFTVGALTGQLPTGIVLTRIVKEILGKGLLNSTASLQKITPKMVEDEFYSILADGISSFTEGWKAEVYMWVYGMANGLEYINAIDILSEEDLIKWKETLGVPVLVD